MNNAGKILTDSGGIQKEAYMLGKPCITLRENTEWIETVDVGWNVLVGADMDKIVKAAADQRMPDKKPLFYGENVSEKIAGIINRL